VIDELDKAGLRKQVRVIVGGAPVNANYARSIGADGYAADASEAVDTLQRLFLTSPILSGHPSL
jgi:5-methyltetrahydrofolate--homocysteine methyltransferase